MQALNPKKNPNYVQAAEIWKDHVRHEYQAWRNWPDRWGFITKEYIRMNKRLRGERVSPDPEDKYFYANCERESPIGPDDSASRQFQPSDQSLSPAHSGAKLKRSSAYSNLPSIINGSSWKDKRSQESSPDEVVLAVADFDVDKAKPRAKPAKLSPITTIKPTPPVNRLETFGRAPNARGHQGILKQFNWPVQGIM